MALTHSKGPSAAGSTVASLCSSLHANAEVNISKANVLVSGLPHTCKFLLFAAGLTKVSHLTSQIMSPHVSHHTITPFHHRPAGSSSWHALLWFAGAKTQIIQGAQGKDAACKNSHYTLHSLCCVLVKPAWLQEDFAAWAF